MFDYEYQFHVGIYVSNNSHCIIAMSFVRPFMHHISFCFRL